MLHATKNQLKLSVTTVIGTGDPFDGIMLVPLISDWGVPRDCIFSVTGEPCAKPLRRLYVLSEPLIGFGGGDKGFLVVGACEDHHSAWQPEGSAETPDLPERCPNCGNYVPMTGEPCPVCHVMNAPDRNSLSDPRD